jgi:pimeloyl-ACP methyl ester carboxylesterase
LLLGARFPAIKAVIGNVPSNVVYGGLASTPDEDDPEPPAWTYRGEGLPFLRSHRNRRNDFSPLPGVPFELTPGFLRTLEDAEQVRAASIPVENIAGPVLLVSGREDAMWPSSVYSERVMQRLAEHRHPYPDQHLSYAGAGHMIGFPYVPSTIHSSLHALTGHLFAFGGNPAATAHAKADSWPRVLAFLEEALRAEETS